MSTRSSKQALVKGEWRSIVFLSYAVPPRRLAPYVPRGLELDLWEGNGWVSLVALKFKNTRVLGIPVPFEQNHEQINLRFYVKRRAGPAVRRAVVVLREIVPAPFLAMAARLFLNEPYSATHTESDVWRDQEGVGFRYGWGMSGPRLNFIEGVVEEEPLIPKKKSVEHFLTARPWAYTPQRTGNLMEFHAGHPSWEVAPLDLLRTHFPDRGLFPAPFADIVQREPDSALYVIGSKVRFYLPRELQFGVGYQPMLATGT